MDEITVLPDLSLEYVTSLIERIAMLEQQNIELSDKLFASKIVNRVLKAELEERK